ncbi:MAG: ABC transporter ATP-binding protein [Ruminiclostridium sp.]|nr:ABC transporter ATP-binding protein [Ruminiclostridium sp.]
MVMNDNNVIIKTDKLTKKFGSFAAVNNLDILVRRGSIHGFVGPNGAGKTTTIKMLIGAMHPTRGSGSIAGHPLGSIPARRLLGYSPEFPVLYNDLSAVEYLVYMAYLGGIPPREGSKRAVVLLDKLGLVEFKKRKVGKYSAGMRKKIGLAQAIITEPELLILDEPTANLDPTGRMEVVETLKQLVKTRNTTIFISSHILTELEQLVDDVTMINKGETVIEGNMGNIKGVYNKGRFILKTSDNARVMAELHAHQLVSEIKETGDSEMLITTENPAEMKNKLVEILYTGKIILDRFAEEDVSLENIYRQTMSEGGR